MTRPEDELWWDHMQRRGPRTWAREMFLAATYALAILDRPLRERLRIAYAQNIYPLFQAREVALEAEERPPLEEVFYSFYKTPEYRAEPGEEPVKRALEGMSGNAAEELAVNVVRLSFEVCAKIPPDPKEAGTG